MYRLIRMWGKTIWYYLLYPIEYKHFPGKEDK